MRKYSSNNQKLVILLSENIDKTDFKIGKNIAKLNKVSFTFYNRSQFSN